MRQSTRLILNTGATYVRMGVTVGIGLASTAIALKALGASDLGVYGAMLAAAGLGMIASDSLAFSSQRQMSIAIGKKDERELRRVLTTVMSVVLLLGVLPIGVSLLLGHTIIGALDVPEARHEAAWWALQWCMATFAAQLISSPFKSLLLAHQDIVTLTLVEIGESVFRLVAALAVLWGAPGDKLVMYASLCAGGTSLSTLVLGGMCMRLHPVSRVQPGAIHTSELRELTRIAGWDVVLQALWRVRTQGGQILLNVAFGPVVNSANTIANQAAGYQNNFAVSILRAAHPAIASAFATGNTQTLHRLVLVTSKYMALAMTLLLVPLVLETQTILDLWLGKYPDSTPMILKLTALWVGVSHLAAGHNSALYAVGHLRKFTVWMAMIDGVLFFCACMWLLGAPVWLPTAPSWSLAALTLAATSIGILVRAWVVGGLIALPVREWVTHTVFPSTLVAGLAGGACWLFRQSTEQPLIQLALTCVTTGTILPILGWRIAMCGWEREQFTLFAKRILSRRIVPTPAQSVEPSDQNATQPHA